MWCRVVGNNLIGPHVIKACASLNIKTNVAKTRWITSTFRQSGNGISEGRLQRKMDRNSWTGGFASLISRLKPITFFSVRLHEDPETRHQLVGTIDEAVIGIRNKVGCT
jgi:hypothetical protein